MKKLLLISFLTFFSISAIAEDNFRCKYYKYCEGEIEPRCSTNVNEAYVSVAVDEGWFTNKIFIDGNSFPYSKFNKNYIETWTDYTLQHRFDRVSLVLVTRHGIDLINNPAMVESFLNESKLNPGTKRYVWSEHFLCTKLN